ncbi:hypothetical protein [Amycolatopsis sp. NPDC059657]|uniref:hypothetical protein n=1 Tax=Amycolatopsis sp. NPDC059657 TaxID=3346899 RepID=UPI00366ACEDE
MATQDSAPSTAANPAQTLEQVLAQVSTADPQTFYQEAQRFEQAASRLHDVQGQMDKHRRDLAEAWYRGDKQRHDRLDRLIRHVEGVVGGIQNPGYPRLLRQIGDAISDTKQRLADLKDGKGSAEDDKARGDIDKRATTLLAELSTLYRQLGGQLVALPHRADTTQLGMGEPGARTGAGSGGAVPVVFVSRTAQPAGETSTMVGTPVVGTGTGILVKSATVAGMPVHGAGAGPFVQGAGTPARGGGTGTFTTAGVGQARQLGFGQGQAQSVSDGSVPLVDGSVPPPATATPFARFSQFAGCPLHGGGSVQGGKAGQVAGLAGRVSVFAQSDTGKPAVLGRTASRLAGGFTLDVAKQSKENSQALPATTGGGNSNRYELPDISAPAKLQAQPTFATTAAMPVTVSAAAAGPIAQPGGGSPAYQQVTSAAAGLLGGGPAPGGPMPGGSVPGPPASGASSNGLTLSDLTGSGPTAAGPAPSSPASAGVPTTAQPPAPAHGAVLGQAPASTSVQMTGTPGITGVTPPQPSSYPAQTTLQASIPTQVRPVMALGAEHLQLAAAVSPGSSGMPLGAFTASSNLAPSGMSAGGPMQSAANVLPAGPHGVLGAGPRTDGVWMRADPGCWISLPVAAARLGRDDTAETTAGTWSGTERYNEYGKEGR